MNKAIEAENRLSSQEKRQLLTKLLQRCTEEGEDTYPLSFGQQALWFLCQIAPDNPAYNLMYMARLEENADTNSLNRALKRLADRHPSLRTTYHRQAGHVVQKVNQNSIIDLQVVEANNLDDEQLEQKVLAEADRPFNLMTGPLVRAVLFKRALKPDWLLLVTHHIAVDGWSFDLLRAELNLLYAAEKTGDKTTLPPLRTEYRDYVRWQAEMLAGPEGERLWQFWKKTLNDSLSTLNFPTDRPRPKLQTYNGELVRFNLSEGLCLRLQKLARQQGVTLYTLMLSAFQVLLHRYCGQDDVLVGSPTSGRSRAELEGIVGYFVNPIVLRADLSGMPTFTDYLARNAEQVVSALAHQDYPFQLLVQQLHAARDPSRSPLFQVMFDWIQKYTPTWQEYGAGGSPRASNTTQTNSLRAEQIRFEQRGAAFDLMLMVVSEETCLSGSLHYNSDLFDRDTVERILGHFEMLLEGIVDHPGKRIDEYPLLTDKEYTQIVVQWNATKKSYPQVSSIHALFEAKARQTPNAIAVVDGNHQITYGELNRRANQLSHYLRELGVGREELVGVCMDRSAHMIIAILAILKAGGAYVPLDPSYPHQRLNMMLKDCQAKFVLTQERLRDQLADVPCRIVRVDALSSQIEKRPVDNPDSSVKPEHLAYVIYTSGSTGQPKGVAIEHRSTIALIHWAMDVFSPEELAGVLFSTSVCFDLSIFEMFVPLSVGGSVILAENALNLPTLDNANLVTLINTVPSAMAELLRHGQLPEGVVTVNLAGETLTPKLVKRVYEEASVARVYDLYGPAEDTTYSTFSLRVPDGRYTVGKPIANTHVYILDGGRWPVPIGVPGELYLAGYGLAREYFARPELTSNQFVSNPFGSTENTRLYKTGDLARWLPDGNIDLLGRVDDQVKIRGYRIEPGEVESVLAEHPAVKDVAVISGDDGSGRRRLVSYLVFEPMEPPAETPTISELRSYLNQTLPSYMIPSAFAFLDELPRNSGGKINRNALPTPETTRPALDREFVAPKNRNEEILAEVWQSVLGIDRVGVNDNFFELGGASTQSLEIAALAAENGLEIAPVMLFQHQTIAELATACPGLVDAFVSDQSTDGDRLSDIVGGYEFMPALDTMPQPREAGTAKTEKCNVVIESLGAYLPPKSVTTAEVIDGCRNKVWFPLASMTGIRSRRMVDGKESSFDLARKAVDECLPASKYRAEDIGLVVCCNIVRLEDPRKAAFEPCTAIRLRHHFGFENALAFDISNACAGMFTGLKVVEAFIQTGVIRCGLAVSGEYITAITETAQREISEFIDPRLACLTVGDAGAAVMLEAASNNDVGFHDVELYTLSRHADLCVGRLTNEDHGGAIMHVPDPIKQTSIAVKHAVSHADHLFNRSRLLPEEMQYLIMHQTSERSLTDAAREINKVFGKEVCNKDNMINNLTERGNTASTTHFVALWDNILNGKIQSGDNVCFGISGSGQTVGTAIYTFDDFPDRLRLSKTDGKPVQKVVGPVRKSNPPMSSRIGIESIGTLAPQHELDRITWTMTQEAGKKCLAASSYDAKEIDLVIFAGVHRTDLLCEPAIAALVARDLEINAEIQSDAEQKTFAFDIFDGGIGFLNACDAAARMIQTGDYKTAMIVASEFELNRRDYPDQLLGLKETASAVILDASSDGNRGFGRMLFHFLPEHFDAHKVFGYYREGGRQYMTQDRHAELDQIYLKHIPKIVDKLLTGEGLESSQIKALLPPQISSEFIANLASAIDMPPERAVDIVADHDGLDLHTSTLPYTLQTAFDREMANPGDIGLIINIGSGLQIGCALYYF